MTLPKPAAQIVQFPGTKSGGPGYNHKLEAKIAALEAIIEDMSADIAALRLHAKRMRIFRTRVIRFMDSMVSIGGKLLQLGK